jgi:hypothetical protein
VQIHRRQQSLFSVQRTIYIKCTAVGLWCNQLSRASICLLRHTYAIDLIFCDTECWLREYRFSWIMPTAHQRFSSLRLSSCPNETHGCVWMTACTNETHGNKLEGAHGRLSAPNLCVKPATFKAKAWSLHKPFVSVMAFKKMWLWNIDFGNWKTSCSVRLFAERIHESNQQGAAIRVNLLFLVSSTCFGRCFRPSSETLDCIHSIW